jgi:murein DD-endopeptidase MepM/ murein hydrolase activator NlpD
LVRTTQSKTVHEIYLSETGGRLALRLKWVLSTLIAGAVGLCIIGVVIYASNNMEEEGVHLPTSWKDAWTQATNSNPPAKAVIKEAPFGTSQKTDRIKINAKGTTTNYLIQDSAVERRGSREFIAVRPYIRVVASLGTAKPDNLEKVPPFNPFELYSSETPTAGGQKTADAPKQGPTFSQQVRISYSALMGGALEEDGQELASDDVERLVAETDAVYAEINIKSNASGTEGEGDGQGRHGSGKDSATALAPHTTVIQKKADDAEEDAEEEDTETRSLIAEQGDTVQNLIKKAGAEEWQAHAIAELMATSPAGQKLKPGQELRFTLTPAANPTQKDPIKVSLFTGLRHDITVTRSPTGEYGAGGAPVDLLGVGKDKDKDEDEPQRATLYNSIFQAAFAAKLPVSSVLKLLRVHTYDVDYKTKAQAGDGLELFFDSKEDGGGETPSELLFTSMSISGESYRYYRFRTPDGYVDYYNESGSSSKKFLMHMPVRAGRFTSGFGFRRHPILGVYKMHTGVDWAAPVGSPILASGNGVIETAGWEHGYGNYIRIKHGNGYKTAYGHMSRFASGMEKGLKVRQGQLIGYVGSTGQSSGPHLHYEVLVNNHHVNPMGISIPRGRLLTGRLLADFKKERSRIDSLMARAPVKTRVAAIDH